jgi:DNA primase
MTSTWVDFKAVKHTVSMEMALAYYGVMLRRIHGPCLRGRCPLPSHASRSSAQSLIVDIEKNAWACHSGSCVASRGGRTGGNVLDFVAAMERCSVRDAALKLQEWFAVAAKPAPRGQIVSPAEAFHKSSHTDTGESNKPLPFTLWGIDLHHPYLSKRRVDSNTAANFGIGFYPGKGSMEGRIVIPIHNDDGILVAYAGRSLDQSEPRYKFPARFRKSLVLFNLHHAIRHGKAVIVVEGFFDCLNVYQAGFPCVVALMGCSLSQRQEVLLQNHFQHVTLMLDGDNAGRRAGAAIAARLVTKLAVRVVEIPLGSQPDQLGADQIHCLCDPDFF